MVVKARVVVVASLMVACNRPPPSGVDDGPGDESSSPCERLACFDVVDLGVTLEGKPAIGDFDGDGSIDLAFSPSDVGTSVVSVALQSSPRQFALSDFTTSLDDTQGAQAGDFDGDGRTDLAVTASQSLSILFNTQAGLTEGVAHFATNGDFYGDVSVVASSDGDRILAPGVDLRLQLYSVSGGELVHELEFPTVGCWVNHPHALLVDDDALGDVIQAETVTCDALPDREAANVLLYRAEEGGGFADPITYESPVEVVQFASGDLDADGKKDLIGLAASFDMHQLQILPGATSYDEVATYGQTELGGVRPSMVFVTALATGAPDRLWLYDSATEELSIVTDLESGDVESLGAIGRPVAVHDVDGDGLSDVVLVDLSGGKGHLRVAFQQEDV